MCSVSYNDIMTLRPRIYKYLGSVGKHMNNETDIIISDCFKELEKTAQFNYLYKYFEEPPQFLDKEPYKGYLRGSRGVIVCAMTLGISVDRLIKRLLRTDTAKGTVMNACGSAYLEYLSDRYEKNLGKDLNYRFCPGYGGSDVSDIRYIFEILNPGRIGMVLNENNFMLPAKSMAGIIAVGGEMRRSCEGCIIKGSCRYAEEGTLCCWEKN